MTNQEILKLPTAEIIKCYKNGKISKEQENFVKRLLITREYGTFDVVSVGKEQPNKSVRGNGVKPYVDVCCGGALDPEER
ncbi:MAG: hypothetical protein ACI4T8_02900 [Christensenellales bacterium]